MTVAWVFDDPETAATYVLPINPNKMSSPHPVNVTDSQPTSPVDGRTRARRGAPLPRDWTFGGVIRTQEHYDALLAWTQKDYPILVTDHLAREWSVLLTEFAPTERRTNARVPDRYNYEIKAFVLAGPL